MSTNQDIICKFTLSCGNFGIYNETEPNLFAAFWGISLDIKIGTIINGVVNSHNITHQDILNQFNNYLKEKSIFFPTLMETIPKLMVKLHIHDEIDEIFVSSVAIQNVENIIPVFYICDHPH